RKSYLHLSKVNDYLLNDDFFRKLRRRKSLKRKKISHFLNSSSLQRNSKLQSLKRTAILKNL
ncbi:hypothetical protein SAMD00019534_126860, partial [Acytostelium subglobosum LB1]|uniref:hypothetical protein n=1 Tax=Acytostelium subglobosum LB1 TaxID=1410327 RepID=UPI000644A3B0